MTQACRHVLVAFGDHRGEQLWCLRGKFTEARFQQVALLEFLDIVFIDVFIDEQTAEQASRQIAARSSKPWRMKRRGKVSNVKGRR